MYILAGLGVLGVGLFLFVFFQNTPFGGSPEAGYGGDYAMTESAGLSSYDAGPSANDGGGYVSKGRVADNGFTPPAVDYGNNSITDRKVIRNGSLSLIVDSVEKSVLQIKVVTADVKGFVANSNIYEVSDDTKAGSVTVRVPAETFDNVVERIKEIAVKVEGESSDARDVTEEFVDLEAQLKNLRAEEEQYLEIMEEARKIEDILNVSQRLSDVRGRIERIEGQLKVLNSQIDMSTLTISLTSEADIEVFGIHWKPLFEIKQALRDMLDGGKEYLNAMIAFIFYLPVLALWVVTTLVIAVIGFRILRFVWRRFIAKKVN